MNYKRILVWIVLGGMITVGLLSWVPSAEENEDAFNVASWLALSRGERAKLTVAEDSASHDSLRFERASDRYHAAQATRDSLQRVIRAWEVPGHSYDDTVQFSFVKRPIDSVPFRVPSFLVVGLSLLMQQAENDSATVQAILQASRILDAQRLRVIDLYRLALYRRDSVISKRDERIAQLSRSTWHDHLALTAGVDLYGKPNATLGVKVWPRVRRAKTPIALPVLPNLLPHASDPLESSVALEPTSRRP